MMTESNNPSQKPVDLSKKDKKAFELANKAFALIGEHQTAPYPSTYALWYAYASGSNNDVVAKVDEAIEKSGTISVYDIGQIHDAYLAANQREKARSEKIGQDFETEIADVMKLMQKSLINNDQYSSSLSEAQELLPDAVSPEKVGEIVSKLIDQNREMKEMTQELNEGLQSSQSQIQELNGQLAEAREESMRDGLTQLANRRAFDERLSAEIENAATNGTNLSLVIADIDHFKSVNDTYGHQVGDGVLQTFAALISKNIKGQDMAARYGGEEFALILPQTKLEEAFPLVEKIRKDLEASKLVIKSTGQSISKVTSSFGISILRSGMNAEDLIRRADQKLYDAKHGGRNRIELDHEDVAAA